MSWLQIKKKKIIALILILCNNNEPLLDRIVMCDEKLILYNWQQPAQ